MLSEYRQFVYKGYYSCYSFAYSLRSGHKGIEEDGEDDRAANARAIYVTIVVDISLLLDR